MYITIYTICRLYNHNPQSIIHMGSLDLTKSQHSIFLQVSSLWAEKEKLLERFSCRRQSKGNDAPNERWKSGPTGHDFHENSNTLMIFISQFSGHCPPNIRINCYIKPKPPWNNLKRLCTYYIGLHRVPFSNFVMELRWLSSPK